MTRIGITGHRSIPRAARPEILHRLVSELKAPADEALSCLADGADQLFAAVAVEARVPLTAVIPADDYEEHLGSAAAVARYRRLLASCTRTVRMPYRVSGPPAYAAAGHWIVDHVDHLIAVWDGLPARGLGGTAQIAAYAREVHVPVTVVWPQGVVRA
ncbi:hypothetical protein GCM10012287_30410 [Streptomyces daqingensis]|uniref:Universal stress protein n=1 Tax=Streptomyces daqingensis TaxID=1472640 RepID=A0ABQ2MEW6_9ACTN|nr:hypothetical protein [Streptomyces daqingensis]GGO50515.1 hypothetical protein GCM10012287_30410 [Streptomyces daqingensis]